VKKYEDFLNENDVAQEEPKVYFDESKYNDIVNKLQYFWKHVKIKRKFDFSKASTAELQKYQQKDEYKEYLPIINKELDNRKNTRQKIEDARLALVSMGYNREEDQKRIVQIIKSILNEKPNLTASELPIKHVKPILDREKIYRDSPAVTTPSSNPNSKPLRKGKKSNNI